MLTPLGLNRVAGLPRCWMHRRQSLRRNCPPRHPARPLLRRAIRWKRKGQKQEAAKSVCTRVHQYTAGNPTEPSIRPRMLLTAAATMLASCSWFRLARMELTSRSMPPCATGAPASSTAGTVLDVLAMAVDRAGYDNAVDVYVLSSMRARQDPGEIAIRVRS